MFSDTSNVSAGVDRAFAFIIIVSLIFLVAITAFVIYILIRYARKRGHQPMQFTDNIKLEILWTAVPIVLVVLMFYYGWVAFAPMRKAPADAMQIKVIGKMWEWVFVYGDSLNSKELVIPVDKAVKLNLVSEDVNHGFFIPAFRVKEDVIPGYENYMWFIPHYIGNYEILCTQYCGLLHANMLSYARVVDQKEFNTWLTEQAAAAKIPEHEGLIALRNTGCLACHSIDGTKLVGPSFKGLYGSQRKVTDGGSEITLTADDDFMRKSVYEPDAEIAEGFSKGLMKSYTGVLSEEDFQRILNYMKSLVEEK